MVRKSEMVKEIISIPEDVEVKIENNVIYAKGPKGEMTRKLVYPGVNISVENKNVVISCKEVTKREKAILGTFKAHVKNILLGVKEGYVYKLKICSSHFPMNVSISNGELIVKNFFGEKVPRKLKLKEGATVKVDGDIITVESVNKEIAGQVAADIEKLTRRTKYDRRIFQDGIYIIEKAGKELE